MMLKLFKENIRIAFGSIKTQILRTILTVLIIAIGITALVGILTVVSALENTISSDFASMGANTFNINQYENKVRNRGGREREVINPIISYPEAVAFKNKYKYPFTETSLSFTATTTAEVKYLSEKTDPEITIVGVDEHFITNSGLETSLGRSFNQFDIENNTYSCIVGSDFEKGLLKDINPIDKIISIRGARFKVIGVLKEKGSTFGNSQDLRVLIPIQVARSLFTAPNINYTISVMVSKKEVLDEAIDNATSTMRRVRKLSPVRDNNFGIVRSDDLINRILSITQYLGLADLDYFYYHYFRVFNSFNEYYDCFGYRTYSRNWCSQSFGSQKIYCCFSVFYRNFINWSNWRFGWNCFRNSTWLCYSNRNEFFFRNSVDGDFCSFCN